jgi:hypothetical protein
MNKKIILISSFTVLLTFGFLYINQTYLCANDKQGCDKSSFSKSGCDDKKSSKTENTNKQISSSGDKGVYEFTTDQACCEQMKAELQSNLLSIAGVKEVEFGSTCSVSKMTNVKVIYAADQTTEETIAALVKQKDVDCSTKSGCDKDGVKSGDSKKEGCDSKKECPSKDKKTGKNL